MRINSPIYYTLLDQLFFPDETSGKNCCMVGPRGLLEPCLIKCDTYGKSSNDNWEKLVAAVLRREELRALAHCKSFSSISDSGESSFTHSRSFSSINFSGASTPSHGWSGSSQLIREPVLYSNLMTIDEKLKSMLPPGQNEIVWTCLTFSMDKKCFKIGKDVHINGKALWHKYYYYMQTKNILTIGPKGLLGSEPYKNYPYSKSRLSGVAYQHNGLVDIRGKIEKQRLSWHRTYGAYLVYRISDMYNHRGNGQDVISCERALQRAIATIRFVNDDDDEPDADVEVELREKMRIRNKLKVFSRHDGMKEIEMGELYIDDGNQYGKVEAQFKANMLSEPYILEIRLTFEGIEFRPID